MAEINKVRVSATFRGDSPTPDRGRLRDGSPKGQDPDRGLDSRQPGDRAARPWQCPNRSYPHFLLFKKQSKSLQKIRKDQKVRSARAAERTNPPKAGLWIGLLLVLLVVIPGGQQAYRRQNR